MKYLVLFIVCLYTMIVFIGCETLKGMGKDIENTGNNIQDAAGNITK